MKLLIAIPVGHGNPHLRQACRDTWIGKWKDLADIRFFYGRPVLAGADDEVYLDVPDEYLKLPLKIRQIILWALERGYDRIFKCDDDTYLHIPRLLASMDESDYRGRPDSSNRYVHWAQGGAGYWLSRHSMEWLATRDLKEWEAEWAEDKFVGMALTRGGIGFHPDYRFFDQMYPQYPHSIPRPENGTITTHKVTAPLMYEIHKRFQ